MTQIFFCSFDRIFHSGVLRLEPHFQNKVLQAAILETIILGVMVSLLTGLGIILGVIAVIMLAFAKTALTGLDIASCFSRTSAIGLASGTSWTCYRLL